MTKPRQSQAAPRAGSGSRSDAGRSVRRAAFAALAGDGARPAGGAASHNLDLLLDVSVQVSVEIGRARLSLQEVLDLVPGSVIALDKRADEPVDLRVNGKLVARGEVVMVGDSYGLRVTEIAPRGALGDINK